MLIRPIRPDDRYHHHPNLNSLLWPKSVALIAASSVAGSDGNIAARTILPSGFNGPIWFDNPRHATIEGQCCFGMAKERAEVSDLTVIATPANGRYMATAAGNEHLYALADLDQLFHHFWVGKC